MTITTDSRTIANRTQWLAHFGYAADAKTVRLRDGQEANVNDVWRVLTGLRRIQQRHDGIIQFRRICDAAAEDYEPLDRDDVYCSDEYGQLTDSSKTGSRRPIKKEYLPIIRALTDVDNATSTPAASFAEIPLERNHSAAA